MSLCGISLSCLNIRGDRSNVNCRLVVRQDVLQVTVNAASQCYITKPCSLISMFSRLLCSLTPMISGLSCSLTSVS